MAIALVTNGQGIGNTNPTTASLDTTGATLLVAVCTFNGSVSVSDNKSNTWSSLTVQANGGVSNQIFYVNSNTPTVGTGHTFTLNGTGIAGAINVLAFNGSASSPFDVQNGFSAASGSTIQPGSVTPSQNNEVVITGVTGGNTMTTVSINSGFTITNQAPLTGGSNYGSGAAYLIQTTASAVNPTWTFANGSTANISATIATFKEGATPVVTIKNLTLLGVG